MKLQFLLLFLISLSMGAMANTVESATVIETARLSEVSPISVNLKSDKCFYKGFVTLDPDIHRGIVKVNTSECSGVKSTIKAFVADKKGIIGLPVYCDQTKLVGVKTKICLSGILKAGTPANIIIVSE
jgi:hypothetical protein